MFLSKDVHDKKRTNIYLQKWLKITCTPPVCCVYNGCFLQLLVIVNNWLTMKANK